MKKVLIKSLKNWWSQLVNEIVEAVNLQQSKFLLKVASVTFFIFFFVSVKAQAENTNQFVTLNETNSSIEKIIVEIRTQTGYDFLYNARLMKDTKPVTIVVKNEYFKNMKYILLGLGDSNYIHYCGFAKKIDKRLLDLNASKMYDTFYIDSVVNETEEQFDIWVSKIISVLNV
jgi:sulfite reductase alpha subunit-like flavoprotein